MPRFVDTHCHLYDAAFDDDRPQAVARAVASGTDTMLLPDIDRSSTASLDALAAAFPAHFHRMAGLHPTSVADDCEQQLDHVRSRLFASDALFCAVGEIGLDFYWDRTYADQQTFALQQQMQWAFELNLPVALHLRKAHNEFFSLMRQINRPSYRGVMHCFGGSVQEACRAIEMGFHIGVGGVVTFKNASLADVVRSVPLERILLETDAPYLAPVPHRGHRNESAYIPIIAARVAELRGISLEQVAEQTTQNACSLFSIA